MKGLRVTSTASSYSVTNSPTLEIPSWARRKSSQAFCIHSAWLPWHCKESFSFQRWILAFIASGASSLSRASPSFPIAGQVPSVFPPHSQLYQRPCSFVASCWAAKFFDLPGPMLFEQGKSQNDFSFPPLLRDSEMPCAPPAARKTLHRIHSAGFLMGPFGIKKTLPLLTNSHFI